MRRDTEIEWILTENLTGEVRLVDGDDCDGVVPTRPARTLNSRRSAVVNSEVF
jgi:hypothetical protein